ncbi:hypothetical protein HAX54_030735 [Datura stramonium]|uniref:Uncharacterized protein n=1 Tax=Datura stramonium TaxID=4076 RepID=A0ABS8V831_DATST|nr:hypothetical protein [Datura stramonium]
MEDSIERGEGPRESIKKKHVEIEDATRETGERNYMARHGRNLRLRHVRAVATSAALFPLSLSAAQQRLLPESVSKVDLECLQCMRRRKLLDLIYNCDWRAKTCYDNAPARKVVEVLNPLAREYKSIGTVKKELADLQEALSQAHKEVHISEVRVSAALDKLAYMEALVNDRLLPERSAEESDCSTSSPITSTVPRDTVKSKQPREPQCVRVLSKNTAPI